MRTVAFLALCAVATSQESRLEQQGTCLVDSSEAVSDLMDASMFIWAAVARCGKTGEEVKCEINVASAVQSVNSMINVILGALNKCDEIHTVNHECGMAASALTESVAGLTAASGGIAQKCFDGSAHGANWNHAEPAMCVVNVKNTAKNLFKTIQAFTGLKTNCGDGNSRACASNVLRIVSGFAGVGQYLAGAIGQCSKEGTMQGSRCAQESQRLVEQLTKVAQDGVDLSKKCTQAPPVAVSIDTIAEQTADATRLYSAGGSAKKQSALGVSANMVLTAFLPLTAIVGFVGGRTYANRHSGAAEAREFMSDNE